MSDNSKLENTSNSNFNAYTNFGYNFNENEENNLMNSSSLHVEEDNNKNQYSSINKFKHESKLEKENIFCSIPKPKPRQLETIVKWDNLEYKITAKKETKKILDNISGEVNNLEIMAILGPSGAGKSTLLNAIAGKIKNYTGSVKFYSNDKRISFSYVPQQDQLYEYMTVKESLLFASKAKNSSDTNHLEEVEFVLNSFNLSKSKNHYAKKCSGGERKRLSIGLEMISKPKILILDEPTSGLDSTTSFKVIEALKNINRNTVIITTIHQPNSILFQLFDKCYFLAFGKCIYSGAPSSVVDYFSKFNVICPTFNNPADFVLNVANNIETDEGKSLINRLHSYIKEKDKNSILMENNLNEFSKQIVYDERNKVSNPKVFTDPINMNKVSLFENPRSSLKKEKKFLRGYFLNTSRLSITFLRDPLQTIFRIFNCLVFPIILRFTITGKNGLETGCQFLKENSTHIKEENSFEKFDRQLLGIQNSGLLFLDIMFMFFSTLVPSVLVLAGKIKVLKKEYRNSYYSLSSFYFSVLTVNFTLSFFLSLINSISFFFVTNQRYSESKLFFFFLIVLLSTVLGDLFGLALSIIFCNDELTAVVFGSFLGFALNTLSGFFIPIKSMTEGVKALSYLTYCRHTFEAIVHVFYDDNGCEIKESMLFKYETLVELTKYYNHETNNSFQEIEDAPLKVKNILKDKLWNKTDMFELATLMNDLDDDEVAKLDKFWKEKTNYVFEYFGIENTTLGQNFLIISITTLVLIIFCSLAMKYKFKKY